MGRLIKRENLSIAKAEVCEDFLCVAQLVLQGCTLVPLCSSFYRVVCKEALRNYNSLSNPAADAPEELLNELEEVFKKAAKTDTPAEVLNCLMHICSVGLDWSNHSIYLFSGS